MNLYIYRIYVYIYIYIYIINDIPLCSFLSILYIEHKQDSYKPDILYGV